MNTLLLQKEVLPFSFRKECFYLWMLPEMRLKNIGQSMNPTGPDMSCFYTISFFS